MGLLDYLQTPTGMGLLSAVAGGMAGARRGQPINSIGRGLVTGMQGYSDAQAQQKLELEQANKVRAQQAVLNSLNPVSQQPNYQADGKSFSSLQDAQKYVDAFDPQQELGMAMANEHLGGRQLPSNTDFSQFAQPPFVAPEVSPKMGIDIIPGNQKPFDRRQSFINAALANPNSGYTSEAVKALLEQPKEGEKPQLVTVYDNAGKPTQKWVMPGQQDGVTVGLGKPNEGSSPYGQDMREYMAVNSINPETATPQQLMDAYKATNQQKETRAKASAPNMTSINNVNSYEPFKNKVQATMGEGLVKNYENLQNIPQTMQALDAAKSYASKTGNFTGSGADSKLAIAKFFNNNFGTSIDPDGVKNTEALRSALFYNVMDNLKKMDASPSQQQQQVMQDAFGKIGTDPAALPMIIDFYKGQLQSKAKEHNRRVDQTIHGPSGMQFPYDIHVNIPDTPKPKTPSFQGANIVIAPNGKTYNFPTAEAAKKFKQQAGF